jgi:hypothetical protein
MLSTLKTLVSGFSHYVSCLKSKSEIFSDQDYVTLLETTTDVMGCTVEEKRSLFEKALPPEVVASKVRPDTTLSSSFVEFLEQSTV